MRVDKAEIKEGSIDIAINIAVAKVVTIDIAVVNVVMLTMNFFNIHD